MGQRSKSSGTNTSCVRRQDRLPTLTRYSTIRAHFLATRPPANRLVAGPRVELSSPRRAKRPRPSWSGKWRIIAFSAIGRSHRRRKTPHLTASSLLAGWGIVSAPSQPRASPPVNVALTGSLGFARLETSADIDAAATGPLCVHVRHWSSVGRNFRSSPERDRQGSDPR